MNIIEEIEYNGNNMTVVFKNKNNGAYMKIESKNKIIKSIICGFYNGNCIKVVDVDVDNFYAKNFKR